MIILERQHAKRNLSVGELIKDLAIGWWDNKQKRSHSVNAINSEATGSNIHSVNAMEKGRVLPLIDKPVWYRKGVDYTPGQKVLITKKGGEIVTVVAPELDADGNPIMN